MIYPFLCQVSPHKFASSKLLNLTAGPGNKLSQLTRQGDTQGAVQLISVIGNILNENNNVATLKDTKQVSQRDSLFALMKDQQD